MNHIPWLFSLDLNHTEFRLLAYLSQFEVCFQSSQTIADQCKMHRDTFYAAAEGLEVKGLIGVNRRSGQTTEYRFLGGETVGKPVGKLGTPPANLTETKGHLPDGKLGTGVQTTCPETKDGLEEPLGEPVGKLGNELDKNKPLNQLNELSGGKPASPPENVSNPQTPQTPKPKTPDLEPWQTEQGRYLARVWPGLARQLTPLLPSLLACGVWEVGRLEAATKTAHSQTQGYKPSAYMLWILQGERPIENRFLLEMEAALQKSGLQTSGESAWPAIARGDEVRVLGREGWFRVLWADQNFVELETEEYFEPKHVLEHRPGKAVQRGAA